MSKVVMMVGIPGSGKTTLCKSVFNDTYEYISRDDIRYSLLEDNDDYFAKEDLVFETFIKKINQAILLNKNIIIDATHVSTSSRYKVLSQLKLNPNSQLIAIVMNVSLQTALKQNSKRFGRARVPDSAIKNMYKSFQKPTQDEGFCHIITFNEGDEIDVENLVL